MNGHAIDAPAHRLVRPGALTGRAIDRASRSGRGVVLRALPRFGGAMTDEIDRLQVWLHALESEHRRSFDQAQREADVFFVQYQLSQLIAFGGSPVELGRAVIVELVRLSGAVAGAVWLGETGRAELLFLVAMGDFDRLLPERLADIMDGRRLVSESDDLRLVVVGEELLAMLLAFCVLAGAELDADGLRVAQLARHELAVAFGGARLWEVLERERHELGVVVDGAIDVIFQVDEARRVVRLNPAGERMLGIEVSAVIGRTCGEVLGCAAAGGHGEEHCLLGEVIASGEFIGYREAAILSLFGRLIRVAGGYSRVLLEPGGAIRVTVILRDITAVRVFEQLREGFVATVSHELRTSLVFVRGYAETVLYFDLDAVQQCDYVDWIYQVTTRLGSLVDQILDVIYFDADLLIFECAPVAFAALAARFNGDLALSGDDVCLVFELLVDLLLVDVDAGRIGRVLENLVGNVLKYVFDGSLVVLWVSVDGDWLVVTVDDEGVGVLEAERSLVLELFYRAWNVRESRILGTGLGFYICRRLVEAHGGKLWLGDRPDGRSGTRVTFSLFLFAADRRCWSGAIAGTVCG